MSATRDKAARAAKAAASGGAKSGKKGKATTDLAVSGGGSSSSAPEFETTKKICFDLLLDNWKSKELGLAEEEKAKFYGRSLGLQDSYVKQLEWSAPPDPEPQTTPQEISTGPVTAVRFASITSKYELS
jgi:hypothetical protein